MYNFEEIIPNYINTHDSLDIAEYEFKKALSDDHNLKTAYRNWCDEVGYTERSGFRDFASEYLENRDSVWDSLTDYDE